MLKNLSITILTIAMAAGVYAGAAGHTDQPFSKIVVPTLRISPASGARMYAAYCATCHGVSGKGDGPSAAALKIPPADLTVLSKKNGGRYPANHVMTVLEFGPKNPSHGSPEMPVWGPVLGKMDQASSQETQLRINNLSRYLETIQAK